MSAIARTAGVDRSFLYRHRDLLEKIHALAAAPPATGGGTGQAVTRASLVPARKPGPPPGVAPAKARARARVIELRRQGLSTYEISARLAGEGTPLNRTSVGEILTEEGFGRLLRHPAEQASTAVATPGTRPPAPQDRRTGPRHLAGPGGVGQGRPIAAGARPGRP